MTRDTGDDIQSSRQTATTENYNDNNSPGPHLACSLGLQVRSAVLALLVRGGVGAGQQEVRDVSCIVTQLSYSSLTGQSQHSHISLISLLHLSHISLTSLSYLSHIALTALQSSLTSLLHLSHSPSQLSQISFTSLSQPFTALSHLFYSSLTALSHY